MILMVGGHYSYAKVPIGFWMEDWFGWTRNNSSRPHTSAAELCVIRKKLDMYAWIMHTWA
jgi:uncharacterized membrane protein YjdF